MKKEEDKVRSNSWVRIIDDDPDHNKAMEFLLTCKGWKVKKYLSAADFLTEDRTSLPDCMVLDVHMPELTGLELQRVMKEREITLPIIFLTGYGDIDMAVNSILEGAVDFLQKPVNPERLLQSVEKACRQSIEASNPFLLLRADEAQLILKKLTERELEILKLVNKGMSSRVIGERLGISERTVETHRTSACKKLGTHTTAEILKLFEIAGFD